MHIQIDFYDPRWAVLCFFIHEMKLTGAYIIMEKNEGAGGKMGEGIS